MVTSLIGSFLGYLGQRVCEPSQAIEETTGKRCLPYSLPERDVWLVS